MSKADVEEEGVGPARPLDNGVKEKTNKDPVCSKEQPKPPEVPLAKKVTEKRKADDVGGLEMIKRNASKSGPSTLLGINLDAVGQERVSKFCTDKSNEDLDFMEDEEEPSSNYDPVPACSLVASFSFMATTTTTRTVTSSTLEYDSDSEINEILKKYDVADDPLRMRRSQRSFLFKKALKIYPWCDALRKEITGYCGEWKADYLIGLVQKLAGHNNVMKNNNNALGYMEMMLPPLLFMFENSRPTTEQQESFIANLIPVVAYYVDLIIVTSRKRAVSEKRTISDILKVFNAYLNSEEVPVIEAILKCKCFTAPYVAIALEVVKHVLKNAVFFMKDSEDCMRYLLLFRVQRRLEVTTQKVAVAVNAELKLTPPQYILDGVRTLICVRYANLDFSLIPNSRLIRIILSCTTDQFTSLTEGFLRYHGLGAKSTRDPLHHLAIAPQQAKPRHLTNIRETWRDEISMVSFTRNCDLIDLTSDDDSPPATDNLPSRSDSPRLSISAPALSMTATSAVSPLPPFARSPAAKPASAPAIETPAALPETPPPPLPIPLPPQPPTSTHPVNQRDLVQPSSSFSQPFFSAAPQTDQDITGNLPDSTTIEFNSSSDLRSRQIGYAGGYPSRPSRDVGLFSDFHDRTEIIDDRLILEEERMGAHYTADWGPSIDSGFHLMEQSMVYPSPTPHAHTSKIHFSDSCLYLYRDFDMGYSTDFVSLSLPFKPEVIIDRTQLLNSRNEISEDYLPTVSGMHRHLGSSKCDPVPKEPDILPQEPVRRSSRVMRKNKLA